MNPLILRGLLRTFGPTALKFLGRAPKNVTLYRGVPSWYQKQMVRGGRYKGPTHYLDLNDAQKMTYFPRRPMRSGSSIYHGGNPNFLHTTPSRRYAEHAARSQKGQVGLGVDRFGNPMKYDPRVLEYKVPFNYINSLAKTKNIRTEAGSLSNFKNIDEIIKQNEIVFQKGLPKEFLVKVHKLLNK